MNKSETLFCVPTCSRDKTAPQIDLRPIKNENVLFKDSEDSGRA